MWCIWISFNVRMVVMGSADRSHKSRLQRWHLASFSLTGSSTAGHLLRLRDSHGKPLSRERLIEEFSIFFVAGSETTGHTVAWTL